MIPPAHLAVSRNQFTRTDQQQIAQHELINGNLTHRSLFNAHGGSRLEGQQSGDVLLLRSIV